MTNVVPFPKSFKPELLVLSYTISTLACVSGIIHNAALALIADGRKESGLEIQNIAAQLDYQVAKLNDTMPRPPMAS